MLDEEGQPVKVEVKLERPRGFSATVFNAEQGLRECSQGSESLWRGTQVSGPKTYCRPPAPKFPITEVVALSTGQGQTASTCRRRGNFPAPTDITQPRSTLGHWTGHVSRLARDLGHPFGSEGYAKEELPGRDRKHDPWR